MNRPRHLSSSGNTLYELLGLEKTATHEEIRKTYRRLALRHHPDKNLDNPESAEVFKEISRAHTILTDTTKRQIYDQYGSMGIWAAEQFGEENVNTYLVLSSGWCKALFVFCGIITGCYCCCCCFCCCCFCCGKWKPPQPEDEGEYANLHDEFSSPENSTPEHKPGEPITAQPAPKSAPIVLGPPPGYDSITATETTNLKSDEKTKYGADDSSPSSSRSGEERRATEKDDDQHKS